MKQHKFFLFFAIALAAVVVIDVGILIPSMTIDAEATTPVASISAMTTQCSFIDTLVINTSLVMAEASAPVVSTPIATVTQASTLVVAAPTQAAAENNSGDGCKDGRR